MLKYVVDGGSEAVPSGQTAQQAGFESHMAFCQYLANKTLNLDVWDAESLLQVESYTWRRKGNVGSFVHAQRRAR